MPSTKDNKDKTGEKETTRQQDQNPNNMPKNRDNLREEEGNSREKSREQSAGTGRKVE